MTGAHRLDVRAARSSDVYALARLAATLWPDAPVAEHAEHFAAIVIGVAPSTLPLALLVAEYGGSLVGFVEVGLRSHADGCDPRTPVGFIEGWFVGEKFRRHGVGRALIAAAERWAREHGAHELASDTWLDAEDSQRAHEALGFEVVDRCVHFRKSLNQ